jgi:pilus assembly protein Flp/PilA|tara:strand:- start:1225 stop:1413 length:189 start_codon:yes stop_codon:yes gene_type:complete
MLGSILKFLRSEEGPTAVEYSVMLGLILLVVIGSISYLGTVVSDSYDDSSTKINDKISSAVE